MIVILQPIKSKLPNFGEMSPEKLSLHKEASATWNQQMETMHSALAKAASVAKGRNQMSPEKCCRYIVSGNYSINSLATC